jgi:hypothetical protein
MSRMRCRASKLRRLSSGLLLGIATRAAAAQTTLEYAHRVDSLARVWQLAAANQTKDSARANTLPENTVRAGPITVRADSAWVSLARTVASQLAPLTTHAYGKLADRLTKYEFVLRAKSGAEEGASVLSGIVDSTGRERLRGSDYATAHDLLVSWERKTELVLSEEMDPAVREWIKTIIPVDPPTRATWSEARIGLILSHTPVSTDCVHGRIDRCAQVLGLVAIDDPAFSLFDVRTRREVIEHWSSILRRADAKQYDRCTATNIEAACDSLARSIPPDAVPAAAPPVVRQSFARFALMIGGDGAADRFMAEPTPRARIEAATRLPADSVIARWRDTILDARSSSTAIDLETGISALVWAAVCGALAMRSSRWR